MSSHGWAKGAAQARGEAGTHLDVVTVPETTELFLACRVPHVEADRAKVGVEGEGVNLDTESRCEWRNEGRTSAGRPGTRAKATTYRCTSSRTLPDHRQRQSVSERLGVKLGMREASSSCITHGQVLSEGNASVSTGIAGQVQHGG